MKRILFVISLLFCAQFVVAQNNIVEEIQASFGPKVRIKQPDGLIELMGKMVSADDRPQVEGYRVMVYSGNNSAQAREEANRMAQFMRDNFPGAQVYVLFEAPVRVCLYGDYRTREEAEAVMYKLKGTRKFREISVRKCMINLPY